MGALAFWRAVVNDRSNFLGRVIDLLEGEGVRYCVIGGVGVNAYAEPVVTQDLDIIIAIEDMERARGLLEREFKVREFERSYNVYDPDSKLQVQVRRDSALSSVVDRAEVRGVMDLPLPVVSVDDLFELKLAAATEPTQRMSKRGKDFLDLGPLVMMFPYLHERIPDAVRDDVYRFLDRESS